MESPRLNWCILKDKIVGHNDTEIHEENQSQLSVFMDKCEAKPAYSLTYLYPKFGCAIIIKSYAPKQPKVRKLFQF